MVGIVYWFMETAEKEKIYVAEEYVELMPMSDASSVPFGVRFKMRGMPWEDIFWDDEKQLLHMTLKNESGTITNAEELRTYHLTGNELMLGGIPFDMIAFRGLLSIRLDYTFENNVLTLVDKEYQKELCQIDLSKVLKEGENIGGISVGYMSDITLGETNNLYVTPGYFLEDNPEKIFYKNMPVLKAVIFCEFDDYKWAEYKIGELEKAWVNEKTDAVLVSIKDIQEETIFYDEVEWINVPSARATELKLWGGDVPSGVSIYNEEESKKEAVFSEHCEFVIVKGKNHEKLRYIEKKEMLKILENVDETALFHLVIEDGKIEKIQEQYVPH